MTQSPHNYLYVLFVEACLYVTVMKRSSWSVDLTRFRAKRKRAEVAHCAELGGRRRTGAEHTEEGVHVIQLCKCVDVPRLRDAGGACCDTRSSTDLCKTICADAKTGG